MRRFFYHGSMYQTNYLAPGILANGGKWEEFENGLTNEWLYSTTDKTLAYQMGLCRLITEMFAGFHFICNNKAITVDVLMNPTDEKLKDFEQRRIYLYTIPENKRLHQWSRVPGSISPEFYTETCVGGLFGIESMRVGQLLKTMDLTLLFATAQDVDSDEELYEFKVLEPTSWAM